MKRKMSALITTVMLFNITMSFIVYASPVDSNSKNQSELTSTANASKENQSI